MTPEQEKELLEFAEKKIQQAKQRKALILGGNIDQFSGTTSQVLFLDRRRFPPVEEEPPWTAVIQATGTVTQESEITYSDGRVITDSTTTVLLPRTYRFRQGDEEVQTSSAPFVAEYYFIELEDIYEGFVVNSYALEFQVLRFDFPVSLTLRVETVNLETEVSETELVVLDFPNADAVPYSIVPAAGTRVTVTPTLITRL